MAFMSDDDSSSGLLAALLAAGGSGGGLGSSSGSGLLGKLLGGRGSLLEPGPTPTQAYTDTIQSSPFYQGVPSQSGPFGQIAQALMPLIQATQAEQQATQRRELARKLTTAQLQSMKAEQEARLLEQARKERKLRLDEANTISQIQNRSQTAELNQLKFGAERQEAKARLGIERGKLAVQQQKASREQQSFDLMQRLVAGDPASPGGSGLGYGQSVSAGGMTLRGPSHPQTAEAAMVMDSIRQGQSPEQIAERVRQAKLQDPTTLDLEVDRALGGGPGAPRQTPVPRPMTSAEIVAKSANTIADMTTVPKGQPKTQTFAFNTLTPPAMGTDSAAPLQTPVMEFSITPGDPKHPDAIVPPKAQGTVPVGGLSNEQLEEAVRNSGSQLRGDPLNRTLYLDPETGDRIRLRDALRGPRLKDYTDREKLTASLQRRVPNPSERESIAAVVTAISEMNDVISQFNVEYVGPVQGRVAGMRSKVMDLPMEQSKFRAMYGEYREKRLAELIGSARTFAELQGLKKSGALPDFTSPDLNFLTSLMTVRDRMLNELNRKMEVLDAAGVLTPYERSR